MTGTAPRAPLSPDGQYYWDGQRWVRLTAGPAGPRVVLSRGCFIAIVLGLFIVVALVIALAQQINPLGNYP